MSGRFAKFSSGDFRLSIFSLVVAILAQTRNLGWHWFSQSWANDLLSPIKCVPGGIRTPNLLIRSQKLYPVELQALI